MEKLKTVERVTGSTILGDNQVGLILDIHGIFEMDMNSSPMPLVHTDYRKYLEFFIR